MATKKKPAPKRTPAPKQAPVATPAQAPTYRNAFEELLATLHAKKVKRAMFTVDLDAYFGKPEAQAWTAGALERGEGDQYAHGRTGEEALRALLEKA